MKSKLLSMLAAILLMLSCNLVYAQEPPEEIMVVDRMVGERPPFGWAEATANAAIYTDPRSNSVLGYISSGEHLDYYTCVAYLHPQGHAVEVISPVKTYATRYNASNSLDGPVLQPGSYVYLLMYTGEGTYLGWHDGQLLWWLPGNILGFSKNVTEDTSWARYVGNATDSSLGAEVWLKVKTSTGKIGWVNEKHIRTVWKR